MALEARVASWVDTGLVSYEEVCALQSRLVPLRQQGKIGDVILASEHPPAVTFGAAERHNQFSDAFKQDVLRETGEATETACIAALKKRGIAFSRTHRGGGASVVAPGQYVFYPVVDYVTLTGRPLDVSTYKRIIDQVLYDVIAACGVPRVSIAQGMTHTQSGIRERRDVWTEHQGGQYKIGSKGLAFSGRIASHGFVVYAHRQGVELFSLVHACGYAPQDVGVISIEEITGRRPEKHVIHELTKQAILHNFQYESLHEASYRQLCSLSP